MHTNGTPVRQCSTSFIAMKIQKQYQLSANAISLNLRYKYKHAYNETSLIRPPLGPNFMVLIMRWPH